MLRSGPRSLDDVASVNSQRAGSNMPKDGCWFEVLSRMHTHKTASMTSGIWQDATP